MFANSLTTKHIMDFTIENFVDKDHFLFQMNKLIIPYFPEFCIT